MYYVFDHPLIKSKLSAMRDINCKMVQFRQYLEEISMLMVYEVTRNIELKQIDVITPIIATQGYDIKSPIILVPILRAGLGMVDAAKRLIPSAIIGHIGLYRDEKTKLPNVYYYNVPSIKEATYFIFDPMLATGGTAVKSISLLKEKGAVNIKLVCLIGVQEGIDAVQKAHPDVDIYLANLDSHLNENKYIVPGLGDAGDRLFGTLIEE
jgi:uracil phosphoribosyltransferase